MPSKSKVCFFFEYKNFVLKDRIKLKRFIESLFRKENKKLDSISFIFCSDNRLLEINRQFLKHNYYTDIISFDLSEGISTVAEVYISVERVKENAQKIGISFKSELHRVIFHGALHLCGFSDKSRSQQTLMREKENFYLSIL